jgi:hypothetical protein
MSDTHISEALKAILEASTKLVTVNDDLQAMRRTLQANLAVLQRVNSALEDNDIQDQAFDEFVKYLTEKLRDEKWPGNGGESMAV